MWFNVSVLSVSASSRFVATHMRSMGNVLGSGAVMTKLSLIIDVNMNETTNFINMCLETVEFKRP